MAFTKCWLAYPEIRGCRCDAISLHTELTGETIDRAKAELGDDDAKNGVYTCTAQR